MVRKYKGHWVEETEAGFEISRVGEADTWDDKARSMAEAMRWITEETR